MKQTANVESDLSSAEEPIVADERIPVINRDIDSNDEAAEIAVEEDDSAAGMGVSEQDLQHFHQEAQHEAQVQMSSLLHGVSSTPFLFTFEFT